MNYLIIDTSYYNFYRYYATIQWYKNAHPDENTKDIEDWSLNTIFMEKFEKLFTDNIIKYKKKFKIDKLIFARDCPRKEIWRMSIYPAYKEQRDILYNGPNKFKGGPVFKYAYDKILPKLANNNNIQIKLPQLEGDDIIYLCTQQLEKTKNNIYIISSDHDLLQVLDNKNNIYLYTANLKCYNDKLKDTSDKNNFMKAMLGDPSDNIKKVIPRLGEKTAEKLYINKSLLFEKFTQNPESFKLYCLNRLLVDFKYIPNEFIDYFNIHIKL